MHACKQQASVVARPFTPLQAISVFMKANGLTLKTLTSAANTAKLNTILHYVIANTSVNLAKLSTTKLKRGVYLPSLKTPNAFQIKKTKWVHR